ncbi:MAG: Fic family protein [candidate division Zixibacteria bacterium]|nr:Fic family protein [candidate division Zixibacteria bacterium]MDH3937999.1 Fic family protein [candidate division Zixibacteria bacterium]MDH4034273.1 Fic family protein [candidate division Zixibacteria bacterium]
MIQYRLPDSWLKYDIGAIAGDLVEAKSAVISLHSMPYQRSWVEQLQQIELKREVAGTSRIEGADFTEKELDIALGESPDQLITRSQRQAHAAKNAYLWIATIPDDRRVDAELVKEIHQRMVRGADDDHCEPGKLRGPDDNVTFGNPRHRGVSGGDECSDALERMVAAIQTGYNQHDPLVQALAVHYHFAAMHPFVDGNGRTARALEALMLQRAGLRDFCFIAMSNYYYDEKTNYLAALAAVRANEHDLTPFLKFGLKGIATQSKRVLGEIKTAVAKAVYRDTMYDLFNRLLSPRKRVIRERQLAILNLLLKHDEMSIGDLYYIHTKHLYTRLKKQAEAFFRDIDGLISIGAVSIYKIADPSFGTLYRLRLNLDWPTEISDTDFLERMKNLPQAKTYPFL